MKKVNFLTRILMVVITAGILGLACKNDPASNEKGESLDNAPEIPELQEAEPDLIYFEENTPPAENSENYTTAYSYAISFGSMLSVLSSHFQSYFTGFDYDEGYYENGIWIWEWNYSYMGISMQIKYTAEEKTDKTLWNLYLSYSDGETEFDNLNYISGDISKDEKHAHWTYSWVDDDGSDIVTAFETDFNSDSDGIITISSTLFDSDTGLPEIFTEYTNDGADYNIKIEEPGGDTTHIYWNADTNDGYYILNTGNTAYCWDSSFKNIECAF